jgi:hypothetical protein
VPLLPRLRDLFAPSVDVAAPPAAPVRVGGRAAGERRYSASDPSWLHVIGLTAPAAGESVTENTATGISAVWRSCNLIAGSIGTLPL